MFYPKGQFITIVASLDGIPDLESAALELFGELEHQHNGVVADWLSKVADAEKAWIKALLHDSSFRDRTGLLHTGAKVALGSDMY